MISDNDYSRLLWASRRGMLELDLIMVPFVEHRFKSLDAVNQQRFIDLLECEDNELFAWFLGRVKPEDPEQAAIVEQIIDYSQSKSD
ncbi:succinate dehydrogenase assembly factor 2 [uncultured Oceanicoccus sp.]|uniref:FAD assembly factor SdhE n=1 Tax=uncultured Oceanicoccus sp. TaxID=1706381 RepID=UPI0030D7BD79